MINYQNMNLRTCHIGALQLALNISITNLLYFICIKRLVWKRSAVKFTYCQSLDIGHCHHIRMDLLWTKVLALSIVGLGSLLSGLAAIPVRLEFILNYWVLTRSRDFSLFSDRLVRSGKSISRGQILVSSLLSCLGGGVLLATTMIHILPEVTHNLKDQAEKFELESLPQLVVCAGEKYIWQPRENLKPSHYRISINHFNFS